MKRTLCAVVTWLFFTASGLSQTFVTGIINDTNISWDARTAIPSGSPGAPNGSVGVKADGVTDDAPALNTAISFAAANKYGIVQLPCGNIKLGGGPNDPKPTVNLTNTQSITLRGCGMNNTVSGLSDANTNVTTLLCNTGTVCIDTTGSSYLRIQDMNLETRNTFSAPSTVGIMMGRDAASGALGPFCFSQLVSFDRLFITADQHTAVNSGYGFIGLYNIGSEHFLMSNSRIWVDTPAWFSTVNDLALTSPYQNLQNGCAQSMTLVTLINDSFLMVSGHGIVVGGMTHDFQLINQHWQGNTGGWPIVFSGTRHSNWYIRGQVEQIKAPAGFITTGASLDHIDADVATSDQTTNGLGYISFFSNNCCTISNSKFKVTVLNSTDTPQPMIQNAFATFLGGEIDLASTAINTPTGITLVGTIVQASDRLASQVNFASGSNYMVLAADQISFQGPVNFAGPHN